MVRRSTGKSLNEVKMIASASAPSSPSPPEPSPDEDVDPPQDASFVATSPSKIGISDEPENGVAVIC